MPTAKAETIQCRESPETSEYWSWREIDGRRCWYKGHRSISKKLLSWGAKAPAETIERDTAPVAKLPQTSSGAPAERVEVSRNPAPAIDPSGMFETVWQNSMTDLQSHDRAKTVRTIPVGSALGN